MRDTGEGKREWFFNVSQPYLFRGGEMRGLWFCSTVTVLGFLSLSLFPNSTWAVLWTKLVKGNSWAQCLEEPHVSAGFQRLLGVWRVSLNSESGEGFYVVFKHFNKMTNDSKSSQLALCLEGWLPTSLLYHQLCHSPCYFDKTHEAIPVFSQWARRKQNPWEATGSNFHCQQWGLCSVCVEIPGKSPIVRSEFLPP